MKIFFITDLEGIAGVDNWSQIEKDQPIGLESMAQLTKEVNACVDGILSVEEYAQVFVWDAHGSGGIIKEQFHPKAHYIREGGIKHLDESFDAVFYVGQHAMAGTPHAPLAHTYSLGIVYYRLNGYYIGEFGARAALAGSMNIPTVFISGDDKSVVVAKMWIPEIYGAVVKYGLGYQAARHLSSDEACQVIKETAAEACRNIGNVPPLKIDSPYEFEIRYTNPRDFSEDKRPGLTQIDSHTIVIRSDNLRDFPI